MQIRDPLTNDAMRVTPDGRARGYVTAESEISYVSENDGAAYSWNASYNAAAVDTILWLRNDNTEKTLIINDILVSGTSIRSEFTVHTPVNAAPAGTTIIGTNMNRQSGKVALATAIQDETNNTQANVLVRGTVSDGMVEVDLHGGLILGYLDCVAVDFVTASTIAAVTIHGYFHTR